MIKSYAKVNLNLKVYKSRKQLHKIKSVFTIVKDLYDEIKISKNFEKDEIICNIKILENKNYIFKVLDILRSLNVIKDFYKIELKKNILIGSGLGGGSSNAMSVAKYFTTDKKILKKIANEIGTDCHFFIYNFDTALVTKYGNKVKKIKNKFTVYKKDLIFPQINCNTKKVYEKFDEIKAWKNKKEKNMLEIPAIMVYPELKKYRDFSVMSGSGSTFIKKTSYHN